MVNYLFTIPEVSNLLVSLQHKFLINSRDNSILDYNNAANDVN